MSEVKERVTHTPGPWKPDSLALHVFAHGEQMMICNIRGWGHLTGKGGGLGLSEDEAVAIQHANARLIAAAPSLLEALQECDHAFAAWQVGQIPGRPEDILALITLVRAAIAEATS